MKDETRKALEHLVEKYTIGPLAATNAEKCADAIRHILWEDVNPPPVTDCEHTPEWHLGTSHTRCTKCGEISETARGTPEPSLRDDVREIIDKCAKLNDRIEKLGERMNDFLSTVPLITSLPPPPGPNQTSRPGRTKP